MPPISFRGNPMGLSLPAGYTKVNYLEPANDNQYINTAQDNNGGWLVDDINKTEILVDIYTPGRGSNVKLFLGWVPGPGFTALGVGRYNSAQNYRFLYIEGTARTTSSTYRLNDVTSVARTTISVKYTNNTPSFYHDEVLFTSRSNMGGSSRLTYQEQRPVLLGTGYINNTTTAGGPNSSNGMGSGSRYYRFAMKENGIVTHDAIPCLDRSGRPCMFDLVSRNTYYNSGQGEFTWG